MSSPGIPVVRPSVTAILLVLLLGGCAPAISPLYRDYAYEDGREPGRTVEHLAVGRALEAAGWTTRPGPAETVWATEPRTFRQWGLYRVEVELEVAPVSGPYVRVLVHPYRRYFTGGRSKIPYLRRGLARAVLEPLTEALEAEGLAFLGTARQRDRAVGAH